MHRSSVSDGPTSLSLDNRFAFCVFTCDQNKDDLELLRSSRLYSQVLENSRFEIFEVRGGHETSTLGLDGVLRVAVAESYRNLPGKTFEMMRLLAGAQRFDDILKIDDTTLAYRQHNPDRHAEFYENLQEDRLISLLHSGEFLANEYAGAFRTVATIDNVLQWSRRQRIPIDYQRVFGQEDPPPFFSGKFYKVGRAFARFISTRCHWIFDLHQHCLPAEDLMIGHMYSYYSANPRTRLFHRMRALARARVGRRQKSEAVNPAKARRTA